MNNLQYRLIYLVLILVFFQGLAIISGIPSIIYNASIDATILLFFLITFKLENIFKIPGVKYYMLFIVVFIISMIINNSNLYVSYSFLRNTLFTIMFFIGIYNMKLSLKNIYKINKLIVSLVIIQIVAAVAKYIIYGGPREGGFIGTFGIAAGQMSTLFPLFIIIVCIAYLMYYRRKYFLIVIIIGMLFFAYGGGKRAFIVLLPIFVVIVYLTFKKYEYNTNYFSLSNVFRFIVPTILFIPVIILYSIYTPSLNPENIRGGTFDLNHIIEYVDRYHTDDHFHDASMYGGPQNLQLVAGRVHTRTHAYNLISENRIKYLFGFGPSSVHGQSRGSEVLLNFQIVSFQTGISQYYMSVGILGSILIILTFFSVSFIHLKYYKYYNKYWRPILISIPVLFILFIFDFTNYSVQFINSNLLAILYFYLSGVLINIRRRHQYINQYYKN